ncbi:FtsX-like permease family protein [Chryseobacterium sp. POL2]|uniref:ABC transporter permease n=1 Tax=Chryseobacterium sp. POL2 TaxID=2713414 RepID=UPI0013E14F5E|nr:ABC transporter permease [Chryseobacterium sp. POL2]QIG88896.1 FtsX-like permease family protein [Chryseobacterium sp. POL2]
MLKNWLKIAFINYKKNWLSTIINVLGLSLGLCIFLLVFINWQDEKSYEQWVPNRENIYLIENDNKLFGAMSISSYPQLRFSKENYPEVEDFTILNTWGETKIMADSRSVYVPMGTVVNSVFQFFPFEKVAGHYDNSLNDESQIALSEDTARQLFGKDYHKSIGKVVKNDNNNKSYTVSSIYKLPKEKSVFAPGFMIKMPSLDQAKDQWTNYSYTGFLKLKPGTDILKLQEKMTSELRKQDVISSKKWGYEADPTINVILTRLDKMKLDAIGDGIHKGDKKSIFILLGLAALILVLSGINLINLKTAQASQRAKEVGVRKALGSSKEKLIVQFLLENLIICSVAFLVAVSLIELLLPTYNKFLEKELQLNDPKLFVYSGFIVLIFALISGLLPAFYLSNFKPINTLKGNFARSKSGVLLRNFILTIQLIISSFFIICSLIIYTQVKFMMKKDLGFKGDQVIKVDFKKYNYQDKDYNVKRYELARDEVKKIRGVEDVTGSVSVVGSGITNASSVKKGSDTTKVINSVVVGGIERNYFNFYQMKIIAGRDLDWNKASDTIKGLVVNESFVGKMGWSPQQAIGKDVLVGWGVKSELNNILGVVKDFYFSGVDKPVEAAAFFNYDRNWSKNNMGNLQIKLSKDDIDGTIERINELWSTKLEPGYPFEYSFVDKNFEKTFAKFQKQKTLFSVLNGIVLIVALLGLFALSSLLIEQKLKDVAIKKTLGADEKTIVWDLTKKFLIICIIAVFISLPFGYYAMNEWLKDFAYRIDMPVWPYILSLVVLLILTFAVVSIKAYQATKVNLVKYLKYE